MSDPSDSPIWPISPATRPAPKTMKTAIPFAVEDRTTEPASDSAHRIATAAASSIAGSSTRSGHQPPATQVITAASRNTVTT